MGERYWKSGEAAGEVGRWFLQGGRRFYAVGRAAIGSLAACYFALRCVVRGTMVRGGCVSAVMLFLTAWEISMWAGGVKMDRIEFDFKRFIAW